MKPGDDREFEEQLRGVELRHPPEEWRDLLLQKARSRSLFRERKTTPRRKWSRRSLEGAAVLLSILGLGTAAANRWAAGVRHGAVESFRLRGNLFDEAKFEVPLPPDEENFAMLPLLVALRKEAALPEDLDHPLRTRLQRMGADERGRSIKLPKQRADLDLEAVRTGLGLRGTAAEMLEEYDRKHADVLNALKDGMHRPSAVLPPRLDINDPENVFRAASGGILALKHISTGLAIRAGLALEAGRPEIAMESILINRRLSDLVMSEPTALGQLLGWAFDRLHLHLLQKGIAAGAWDAGQLAALRQAWTPRDTRETVARTLNIEGVAIAILYDHWKRDRRLLGEIQGTGSGLINELKWKALPGFWFDSQAAAVLGRTEQALEVIREEGPLQKWWDEGRTFSAAAPDLLSQAFQIEEYSEGPLVQALVKSGSRAAVDDAMARLACRLAEYKMATGSFPATLDSLPAEETLDPLSGEPFRYRLEEGHFVLYSIGPDKVDEGGLVHPKRLMPIHDQPDWLW